MEYMIVNGELYHHGIKGQKWGVRRWQNEDGTFNEAGKRRYFGKSAGGVARRALAKVYGMNEKAYSKLGNKRMAAMNKSAKEAQLKKAEKADKAKAEKRAAKDTPEEIAKRKEKMKKAAVVGASVVAAGLAAYGGYKLYQNASYKKNTKALLEYEAMVERQKKGQRALAEMYDRMAVDAMKNGATSYSFTDNNIGYHIEMKKPKQ